MVRTRTTGRTGRTRTGNKAKSIHGWSVLGALAALPLLMMLLAGCGGTSAGPADEASLSGAALAQAQQLYAELEREHSLHHDDKSLALAERLLDLHPAFSRNDEVLTMAVDAAARLDDRDRALALTDDLLARYPGSPLTDQALVRGAELAAAGGDTLTAAGYLITYHDRDPARSTGPDGTPRAAVYLDRLSGGQISGLMTQHQSSALWTYLGYLNVKAQLGDGQYPAAGEVAAGLKAQAPRDRWTVAALELVGTGAVDSEQIGVLVPLTGRYAVLGNAFYDATLLATSESNLEYGTQYLLKLKDTGADPVNSALAARELCADEGCIAVMGGLLSAPTASAAVVCDLYGVPLISPTATNDKIWKLGPSVFQTNITGLYEVRLLAQLATSVMLKERFAIIHPDTPEGRRHAQVFGAEIESRGGRIVATAFFPAQGTDFKDPILKVRRERPEVIFAPATVDQMVLLGPQLDFFRAGSLVLGLSNWNSNKLRDRSGAVLERAVFPDDLVMFPSRWEDEFNRIWNTETYPPEATALALKAYQATRMLLDTLSQSGAATRPQLADALTRRLSNQDVDLAGPDSFGTTMRMFREERIVPFPAGIFNEGWALREGVWADSLGTGTEDLPAGNDGVTDPSAAVSDQG